MDAEGNGRDQPWGNVLVLFGEAEKYHENPTQFSRSFGPSFVPGPPEYETGALTFRPLS
jgi:hypothetical protein